MLLPNVHHTGFERDSKDARMQAVLRVDAFW